MERITLILSQPWVRDLGWTLIQFLWQGTLLAVAFAISRRFVSTQGRYRLAVGTLIAMSAAPVLTFTAGSSVAAKIPWPISPPIPWEQLLPALAILWAAGTLLFSVRLAYGWRATSLLRKIGVNNAPEEWRLRFHKLAERMGVPQPTQLLLSSAVNTPATIGWLRPIVFLPASILTGLPASQIEALLAHELAHVKRMDYAVNILQSVAEAILFYHPAVWWVSNQIRTEREFICDDLAAAACGDTLEYARALTELESARIMSFALAASDGSLVARIRRLLAPETATPTAPVASTIIAMSVLWIAGAGSVIAQTKEPAAVPVAKIQVAQSLPVPATALLFSPFGPAPQAPTPTNVAPEKKTFRVTGKVITGKDEGVSRAEVTLSLPGTRLAATGVRMSSLRTVFTEADGSFVFEDVPPGDHTITAGKTGFLPLTSLNPNLFVEPNRSPSPVTLRLTPQGVISGEVIDSFGEPVSRSYIEVYRLAYTGGRKQKISIGRAMADDQGRFRVPVLPTGRYYVLASPPPRTNWDTASLTQPTLAPSYYPGVTSLETAALVEVSAGSTSAIAIRMNNDRLHSIRGRITYDGPSVPQMYVQVVPVEERAYTPMNSTGPFGSKRAFPDGKFEIADLPPGRYVLDARVCLGEKGTQCYDGNTGVPMTQGTTEVTVRNSDLEDVVIAVTKRFAVSGTIQLENGDFKSLTLSPSSLGPIRPGIGLEPADSTEAPFFVIPAEDGTFQLLVAKPGLYRAAFTMVPSTVYGKSIRIDGQDALAKPVYISSGSHIEAVLADHPASVSGVVRDAEGNALPGVTVTIWPADPAILLRNRPLVTDRSGAFTFAGLGPGEYRVAAWEGEPTNSGTLPAPAFLAQFITASEKVSLDAGASATTTPKLIPAADIAAAIAKLP